MDRKKGDFKNLRVIKIEVKFVISQIFSGIKAILNLRVNPLEGFKNFL